MSANSGPAFEYTPEPTGGRFNRRSIMIGGAAAVAAVGTGALIASINGDSGSQEGGFGSIELSSQASEAPLVFETLETTEVLPSPTQSLITIALDTAPETTEPPVTSLLTTTTARPVTTLAPSTTSATTTVRPTTSLASSTTLMSTTTLATTTTLRPATSTTMSPPPVEILLSPVTTEEPELTTTTQRPTTTVLASTTTSTTSLPSPTTLVSPTTSAPAEVRTYDPYAAVNCDTDAEATVTPGMTFSGLENLCDRDLNGPNPLITNPNLIIVGDKINLGNGGAGAGQPSAGSGETGSTGGSESSGNCNNEVMNETVTFNVGYNWTVGAFLDNQGLNSVEISEIQDRFIAVHGLNTIPYGQRISLPTGAAIRCAFGL